VSDPTPVDPTPSQPAAPGLSDNAAGALAYVTVIPAIIFLLVEPFNKISYVRFHSWQSVFLHIAAFAIYFVLAIIPIIGWIMMLPVGLAFIVIWVIVIIKALRGERVKLPWIGNLAEKQAGA
jgi:uncharacterized membrane protein